MGRRQEPGESRAEEERSISLAPLLGREPEAPGRFAGPAEDGLSEAASHGDDMANDDPRNPLKNHRNSLFYNGFTASGRTAGRARRPPGAGYGTRYFQNGKLLLTLLFFFPSPSPSYFFNVPVIVKKKSS